MLLGNCEEEGVADSVGVEDNENASPARGLTKHSAHEASYEEIYN